MTIDITALIGTFTISASPENAVPTNSLHPFHTDSQSVLNTPLKKEIIPSNIVSNASMATPIVSNVPTINSPAKLKISSTTGPNVSFRYDAIFSTNSMNGSNCGFTVCQNSTNLSPIFCKIGAILSQFL